MASSFLTKMAEAQTKKSQEYEKQRQKQAKEDDRTWNVLTGNLSSNGTYTMQAAQNKYLAQIGASRQPNIASLLPAPQTQSIPLTGATGAIAGALNGATQIPTTQASGGRGTGTPQTSRPAIGWAAINSASGRSTA